MQEEKRPVYRMNRAKTGVREIFKEIPSQQTTTTTATAEALGISRHPHYYPP